MLSEYNPMQRLSAVGAIAPAFARVHEILFHPFRVGRSWKLAGSNYLAFVGSIFLPFPIFFAPMLRSASAGSTILLLLTALAYFALFCFGAGLGLVQFDMVVTRGRFIAPMWRRVEGRLWPWIGLKVVFGVVLSVMFSPLGFAAMRHMQEMMATMPRATPGQPVDPAALRLFWMTLLSAEGPFLAFCFILKTASTLLDDFVRPFYLLEQVTLGQAFACGSRMFFAEPGEMILYLLMKLILAVAGVIMQYISYFVVMLALVLVGLLIAGVGLGVTHVSGASNAPAAKLLLIVGGSLLYLLLSLAAGWYAVGSFGYVLMLLEAYGIFFVAGRYPLLGRLLEPGPGVPFTPPPVFRSPDEGPPDPPFPLNPAVA